MSIKHCVELFLLYNAIIGGILHVYHAAKAISKWGMTAERKGLIQVHFREKHSGKLHECEPCLSPTGQPADQMQSWT